MMSAQPILYAVTMFFALASLLRWKYRREFPYYRLRRGLQTYAVRVLSELTGAGGFSALKTA